MQLRDTRIRSNVLKNISQLFFEIEVNILLLFTEIEKNNCFSIYTGSDLNNIFRRKPLKIDFIDLSIHSVGGQ